eukprot:4370891-Prymnesium_polylepis.2
MEQTGRHTRPPQRREAFGGGRRRRSVGGGAAHPERRRHGHRDEDDRGEDAAQIGRDQSQLLGEREQHEGKLAAAREQKRQPEALRGRQPVSLDPLRHTCARGGVCVIHTSISMVGTLGCAVVRRGVRVGRADEVA